MHARENRNVDIDVIVHLDLRFRFGLAEDPAHVLDEAPLERKWEGEEERVEWRAVESFLPMAIRGWPSRSLLDPSRELGSVIDSELTHRFVVALAEGRHPRLA